MPKRSPATEVANRTAGRIVDLRKRTAFQSPQVSLDRWRLTDSGMDPSTAGSQSIPPLRSRDRRQLSRFGAFSPASGLGFCDLCDGAISAISSGRCSRRHLE